MKKYISYLDYFFVLRPTLFFPVWTIGLAGVWAQNRFDSPEPAGFIPALPALQQVDWTMVLYLGLFTLMMGAVFLINQIQDVESDRLNNKLFLIANGDIPMRNAYLETSLLTVLPVVVVFLLNKPLALVMVVAYIIMGWMYSCKPLLLKNKPVGGFLPNFFGGYLVFSFGWMIHGQLSWNMLWYATPYILGMMAVYLFTTVPDMEGDRAAAKITVAVKYGKDPVIIAGLYTDCVAIITGILTHDVVVLVPTLLVLPFFMYSTRTKSINHVLTTNKFAALFLSLVICYRFPLYFALIFVLYFFSKWYYKQRFNILYPSLRTK